MGSAPKNTEDEEEADGVKEAWTDGVLSDDFNTDGHHTTDETEDTGHRHDSLSDAGSLRSFKSSLTCALAAAGPVPVVGGGAWASHGGKVVGGSKVLYACVGLPPVSHLDLSCLASPGRSTASDMVASAGGKQSAVASDPGRRHLIGT